MATHLILGYKRHGKDQVAEYLQEISGNTLKFCSSSLFVAENLMYPLMKGDYKYSSWQECFEDRVNHRDLWFTTIANYNKDDLTKLAKEILVESDVYVGMRNIEELEECRKQNIFTNTFWVDALNRKPPEDKDSCTVYYDPSYMIRIDNNGSLEDLKRTCETIYQKYIG